VVELAARVEVGDSTRGTQWRCCATAIAAVVAAGAFGRQTFCRATRRSEAATESAAAAFGDVRRRLYGVSFRTTATPSCVQSCSTAETDLARGNQVTARASYEAFLGYWGESSWELEAVERARKKLEALGGVNPAAGLSGLGRRDRSSTRFPQRECDTILPVSRCGMGGGRSRRRNLRGRKVCAFDLPGAPPQGRTFARQAPDTISSMTYRRPFHQTVQLFIDLLSSQISLFLFCTHSK
jgi:hypothetical protein